ncbi:hypothetical protein HMPREF1531_00320 [Propionibacterium sp. oral taxon 192 str. F0372]|uniref:putative T7SS-secreted protein n=1 Tax=Propionibacterium sp. oral taxon 192 TaxID=671222 RepID=UPI0003529B00|nr:hypothetical protein HMPREF1531_00320 [Propionibacterium sp. oral taxon 192 str. F0372]
MAELGETTDPKQLVPGDPAKCAGLYWDLSAMSTDLETAGRGLSKIDTSAGWAGPAAEAFQKVYEGHPQEWLKAADSFSTSSTEINSYADMLRWAQSKAQQAIDEYQRGNDLTTQARNKYDEDVKRNKQSGGTNPIPPFTDPGESVRQAAREDLADARRQLKEAGDKAASVFRAQTEGAPQKPGLLEQIGSGLLNGLQTVGAALANGAMQLGAGIINGTLSYLNALAHHPEDVVMMAMGVAGILVSGGGEAGGLALSATGLGAVAGVPVTAASGAGLAASGGLLMAALADAGHHAAGEDAVEAVEPGHVSGPSEPGASGRAGRPTDRLKEHLTEKDLDAARRELDGEVVARKPDGTPWNHVHEVRDAQNGLRNRIEVLKRRIGDTRLTEAQRNEAQAELSEASRLLDHSKGYVP